MAIGPGKYDDECTLVRERTGGSVILIVAGGNKGHGFCCQTDAATLAFLPELLEDIAQQLKKDRDGA